ncbi:MAG: aminotransferase class IV [Chlorobiota bacterium]|nr:aminotransferase class IV [Chlorobiota bacterium]QQS67163.1 MAG: aminotransferase class IV [Chlorobiota bacterium]
MSLLFESIKLLDGELYNLNYHIIRMFKSQDMLFNFSNKEHLNNIISNRNLPTIGLYKCKVYYSEVITKIEVSKYKFREINSLKLIHNNEIDYSLKYSDRKLLNNLFDKKNNCDDVLIIKDGFVTDTSYSNIIFKINNYWITPNTPLLKGTCRERLISEKMIFTDEIKLGDLKKYSSFKLINSMNDFNDSKEINVENIF